MKRIGVTGLVQLFPVPILIKKYEKPFEREFNFLKQLKYIEQQENQNFKTSDTYLLKYYKEFSDLKDFFNKSIDDFTSNVWMTQQKLTITQCWANRNPPHSRHHDHIHANSILSGVFYFKRSNTMPPIQFQRSLNSALSLTPERYNNVNTDTFLVPLSDGDLILFPSSLRHSVPVNESNEERYSMSFNTFCMDEMGNEDNLNHLNIKEFYK